MDFGTLSARAVLVDARSGEVVASHRETYAHCVSDDALVPIGVLDQTLETLLRAVALPACRKEMAGICVDATSLTLVPLAADGRALAYLPGMQNRPHAQVKLWKRHTAQAQAQEALSLAKSYNEPFLGRTGGNISSEWMLPKLMEILDEDKQSYALMDRAMDLCEYMTYRLTGVPARSTGSMSYKCLWAQDLGFPSPAWMNALRPELGSSYPRLLRGPVLCAGTRAGRLSPEWCERLGLPAHTSVAAGVLDGHTALVALGALSPGDAALVVGTSNVLTLQTECLREMEGICGIARDGLVPGLYGIDAGQSCVGDMLAWYIDNMLPQKYAREAAERGIPVHALLAEKIREPWRGSVAVTDWWNGSRNAPCDLSLPGTITGLSLATQPEDIYLAFLQSIVCGTREIIDLCESNHVPVTRIVIGGGIAGKNPLLMSQYADLLSRPVEIAQAEEVPALGAAILAAVAAGLYPAPLEAWRHMGVHRFKRLLPDSSHREAYEAICKRNHALRKAMIQLKTC